MFGAIKRELRRRSAIEPVIGHMKAEGHPGRCYLMGTAGDAANAILTAVGHNSPRDQTRCFTVTVYTYDALFLGVGDPKIPPSLLKRRGPIRLPTAKGGPPLRHRNGF